MALSKKKAIALVDRVRSGIRPSKNLPRSLWPSEEIVSRIVDSVGLKPVDTDRNRLRSDLHEFRVKYVVWVANTRAQQTIRKKLANAVAEKTEALFKILHDPPDRTFDLHLWPLPSFSRDQLLAGLQELHVAAKIKTPDASSAPKSWIVESLVPIYEEHFRTEAGASRPSSGGEANGPFVRFVKIVTKEIGTKLSPETIAATVRKTKRA
jgi:hypothetical protein